MDENITSRMQQLRISAVWHYEVPRLLCLKYNCQLTADKAAQRKERRRRTGDFDSSYSHITQVLLDFIHALILSISQSNTVSLGWTWLESLLLVRVLATMTVWRRILGYFVTVTQFRQEVSALLSGASKNNNEHWISHAQKLRLSSQQQTFNPFRTILSQ
jgi:hypothetical protein